MAHRRGKSPLCSLQKLSAFYTGGTVSMTPDGKDLICVCGEDLKVVSSKSGVVIMTLPGDTEPLTAMCLHPSGGVVVTSSRSLVSKVWSLHTGRCSRAWKAHTAPIADIAFDASGGYFATASAGREVKVWDLDAGFCTHAMVGHAGIVLRVLFHPSKALLATAGDDGYVQMWDLQSKTSAFKLKGHVSVVSAIAWTADGNYLLSAGRDKVAVLWDTSTGAKVRSIAILESVETLVVLPQPVSNEVLGSSESGMSNCLFATGGEDGVLRVWSARTGRCLVNAHDAARREANHAIVHLAMMPRSCQILSCTADCTLTFMSFCGRSLKCDHTLLGNLGEVTSATFLGDSVGQQAEAPGMSEKGSTEIAEHGCIAIATNNRSFYALSSTSFGCSRIFEGHSDIVLCLSALCLQSSMAPTWLIASGSKDNSIRVWHVSTGQCLAVGSCHLGSVSAVSFFSHQSPSLVSGGADKLIQTWDLSSVWEAILGGSLPPKPIKLSVSAAVAAHEKEVNCVAVSPSNALVASGGADRNARVWKLPALSTPVVLSGHKRGVWDVQFSPVDQAVLTASGDATLRLWSATDGLCIRTFLGHGASVLRARFSAAGTNIVSSGGDGLLKVWNAQTGHCLFTEEAHDGKVWAMDVGGENQAFAISGADDGSLTLWGDGTKAEADSQRQKHELDVQAQQSLETAVVAKQYVQAAKLAIKLQKPSRLLKIVHEALQIDPASENAPDLKLVTRGLHDDDLCRLLVYVRDWNTSPKHFGCAHALLHAVLASKHPQELAALRGLQDVVEGLVLYSSRHYDRIDRLLQSTFLLDYMQLQLHGYS